MFEVLEHKALGDVQMANLATKKVLKPTGNERPGAYMVTSSLLQGNGMV